MSEDRLSTFFGVICSGCGRALPLYGDPSNGESPISVEGEGKIKTQCTFKDCTKMDEYPASSVQRFELRRLGSSSV